MPAELGRRTLLTGLAAAGALAQWGAPSADASPTAPPPGGPAPALPLPQTSLLPHTSLLPSMPAVRTRSEWAQGLQPTGPLAVEAAGDVRFLLIHHSETGNGYAADEVAGQLRGMYRFHTSPDKGWHDIAYNFLVDAYGTIWEGRAGSIADPVKGDATAGSQGFAQLCCFIGDHTSEPPTQLAQTAMSALLAWLAGRYSIDLFAGPTIAFVSRGSNRWPRGESVTTDPVAGHRDMSQTECPGDACYPLVRGALLVGAQAVTAQAATPVVTAPSASAPPAAAPSTTEPPTLPKSTEPIEPQGPSAAVVGGVIGGGVAIGAAALGIGAATRASRRRDDDQES